MVDMNEEQTWPPIPVKVEIPVDLVDDPKVAERLAYVDKPGEDLRLALDNEKSGEKSLIQKENIVGMEKLLIGLPHAFNEVTDGVQRALVVRDASDPDGTGYYAVTENGIFRVNAIGADKRIDGGIKHYDIPIDAIDFLAVSKLMGEDPGDEEAKSYRGSVVESGDGTIIDKNKVHGVKAAIERVILVTDETSGKITKKRFMEYLKKVNNNHEKSDLEKQKTEGVSKHSISGLVDELD